jgi:hypothetical protein
MKSRYTLLTAIALMIRTAALHGIQLTSINQFSNSDPIITFETGSTALPSVPGVQFAGGDATFSYYSFQCFGSQYFGDLNEGNLDIYFSNAQQAVGAYIVNAQYGSGVIETVYDQSNNVIESESALFPPWGYPPVFLGIGEPSAQIYRVEWQCIGGGYFGVDNVIYGAAIGLSQMPNVPTGLTAVRQGIQVVLNWSAADRATSYNVKRASSSGGPYVTVGSLVVGTNYTDAAVTNGSVYFYVVTGVNGYGESAISQQAIAFVVDHFTFAPIPSSQTSSIPFAVTLQASDAGGLLLTNFNGAVMLSGNGDHGAVQLTPLTTSAFSQGQWTGAVTITSSTPDSNIRLTASSNSVSGLSNPFNAVPPAIQVFNGLQLVDLTYNPFTQRLYGVAPAAGPIYSNSLVVVDPVLGRVETSYYLGNDPSRLAVSGDGQFLYVGFNGTNAFGRFNLTSYSLDFMASLGMDTYYGLLYHAYQLAALPGNPHSVAVGVNTGFGDASQVLLFDDGVERSNIFGGLSSYSGSVVAASGTRLYAGSPFTRLTVDPTGVVNSDSPGGFMGLSDLLKYQAGWVFTPGGNVFNPETLTLIGTLTNCSIVEPDLAAGTIFSMGSHPVFAQPAGWRLYAWNATNLQMVSSLDMPTVYGGPSALVRWGTNGIAFCSPSGYVIQFFLVRTPLVPPVTPALKGVSHLASGPFQLIFTGDPSVSYTVWGSTNFTSWTSLGPPNLVSNGWYWFWDTNATKYPSRFYKVGF